MAASRSSHTTNPSSSRNNHQQGQARLHALQKRTDALYEELHRSSSMADVTVKQIDDAYANIMREFQQQRSQLLQRVQLSKEDMRQSTHELESVHRKLNLASPDPLSARSSTSIELREMNEIERLLTSIDKQIKQYQFSPSSNRQMGKKLGTLSTRRDAKGKKVDFEREAPPRPPSAPPKDPIAPLKLHSIDLDISAQWVVASIVDRLFACDSEGEVRIYSYASGHRRSPLLIERFHLSIVRLISLFTVTDDYLLEFERDTHMISLHTHHGALLVRLRFPYDPTIMIHSRTRPKNQLWICSRSQRQCLKLDLNHRTKRVECVEELQFKYPIGDKDIDPVGVSTDGHDRLAVHDVNSPPTAVDRLILFPDDKPEAVSLDGVQYFEEKRFSRIERILLVPTRPDLLVVLHVQEFNKTSRHELVIVDIESQPVDVLYRPPESNRIQSVDLTVHGDLVYSVTGPACKRLTPKILIYSLSD